MEASTGSLGYVGDDPPTERPLREFTAEEVEALEALRQKLNKPARLAEFREQQRLWEQLLRETANASPEESERVFGAWWEKMKNPGAALPEDVSPALRANGLFYERRQASTRVRAARRMAPAATRPTRPERGTRIAHAKAPERTAAPSRGDPAEDDDEPPRGRRLTSRAEISEWADERRRALERLDLEDGQRQLGFEDGEVTP